MDDLTCVKASSIESVQAICDPKTHTLKAHILNPKLCEFSPFITVVHGQLYRFSPIKTTLFLFVADTITSAAFSPRWTVSAWSTSLSTSPRLATLSRWTATACEHRQQHTTTLVTQAAREGGGDVRQKRLFYGINSTKILKFYLEPANRQNNYLFIYDILFFVVLLFICLHVVLWLMTKCLILLVVMYIYI